ncbi:MAG: glycerol-3-phosphate dehydrogenase C-terminal domain-containing protein, partial [Opitutales bacterium]|nr:glycerol-3-phosphate dehydrogenase C-terminal domain-containing protein [Opitutales bacterium]
PTRFGQFGLDARHLKTMISWKPKLDEAIHERLPYCWAEVLWAIENELVESVEDVLSRRTRSLLLDAQAAIEAAPEVARFMAKKMDRDEAWIQSSVDSFLEIANNYLPKS